MIFPTYTPACMDRGTSPPKRSRLTSPPRSAEKAEAAAPRADLQTRWASLPNPRPTETILLALTLGETAVEVSWNRLTAPSTWTLSRPQAEETSPSRSTSCQPAPQLQICRVSKASTRAAQGSLLLLETLLLTWEFLSDQHRTTR